MIVLILLFISSQTVTELLRVRKWLCDCAFVTREYQFLKEIFCLPKKKKIYISIFFPSPLPSSPSTCAARKLASYLWNENMIYLSLSSNEHHVTSGSFGILLGEEYIILFFLSLFIYLFLIFGIVFSAFGSVYNAFSNVTSSSDIKYINIYIEVIICKGFTGTVLLEKHI